MPYQHTWTNGEPVSLRGHDRKPEGIGSCPLIGNKAVCVGRNYKDHAKEMNQPVPTEPVLFMKPAACFIDMKSPIPMIQDKGSFHYEGEITILIGEELVKASEDQVLNAITGIGLGLDLTLRDLQFEFKDKGKPWEKAKAFDKSCPLSPFEPVSSFPDLDDINISLRLNGKLRQEASSKEMVFRIVPLITHISSWFTLNPGDVIMTGTPAGVGSLSPGDELELELEGILTVATCVAT